jgi:hypothetical protein
MGIPHLLLRALLVSTLIGWGQFVFAADYYWSATYSTATGSGPTPEAAYLDRCNKNSGWVTFGLCSPTQYTLTRLSDTQWLAKNFAPNGVLNEQFMIIRLGDSCAEGAVFNPETGECEVDECEATAGQKIKHEYAYSQHDADGNPTPDPPAVCKDGCQYTNDFGTFHRRRDADNPDTFLGSFTYSGSGVACTSSTGDPSVFDQPPSKPPQTDEPKYDQSNNCSDWVTQPDGTLKRSCSSKTVYDQSGPMNCSGASCSAGSPPTHYNKTDIKQDITKTNKFGGSTTSITTTKTNKTDCKGSEPCTSTTKTDVKTQDTDADGNPGNSSSNCVGDDCKDDGKKDPEEEEKDDKRTANAGSCDSAFSCDGDAIDCEVLKKQKEQLCFAEEQADFDGKKSDIEALLEGDKFKLEEGSGDIEAPSFINKGTRFLPATCPADERFSLTTGGGRTFALSYEPLCRAASDLSGLLVAVTGIFCALYVGRSVGGQ